MAMISGSENLDAIILDHGIREKLAAAPFSAASAFCAIAPSSSMSKTLPWRTLATPDTPSDFSAPSIALPCGSRMPDFKGDGDARFHERNRRFGAGQVTRPSTLRKASQCADRLRLQPEMGEPAQPERLRRRLDAADQCVETGPPYRELVLRDMADDGDRMAARPCGQRQETGHPPA